MDSGWDVRMFRVTRDRPLWHAVYSDTDRFSLGYIVPPKRSLFERARRRLYGMIRRSSFARTTGGAA